MKKIYLLMIILVLISFVLSIYFYPRLPEGMASHWNSRGEVDDYISKFWGSFLIPFILIGLSILLIAVPKIDPLKENIKKFIKYYDGFIIFFLIFMLLIHLQILLWNLGFETNMNIILPIAIGFLFFYLGILVEKAKRNWFIGIRTPWTLSSDKVWDKTHKIGGKLFKIAAIIVLLGVFFSNYSVYFIIIPIIVISLYLVSYSYFEYKKEEK
jgi:uncharacterized membrane protein